MLLKEYKRTYTIFKILFFFFGMAGLVFLLLNTSSDSSEYSTFTLFKVAILLFGMSALSLVSFGLYKAKWGLLDLLVLCFATVCILSSCLNGAKVSFVALQEFFPYVLIYFSVKVFVSIGKKTGETIIFMILCVWLSVESLDGLNQVFGYRASGHAGFRMTGSFSNPGPYGGFVAILISISVAYLFRYRYRWKLLSVSGGRNWKWLALRFMPLVIASISSVLGFMVLPASRSRAGWLAFCMAIFLFIGYETHLFSRLRRYKAAIVALLIVIPIVVSGIFMLKKDSALGRLHIWNMEVRAIVSAPFFGHGLGTSSGIYGKEQETYFSQEERRPWEIRVAGCPEYAFNEYFKIGIEAGLFGGLLLVGIVVVAIVGLMKSHSVVVYGAMAAAVFAFFSYPLSVQSLAVLYALLFGVASGWSRNSIKCSNLFAAIMVLCLSCGIFLLEDVFSRRKTAIDEWKSIGYLSGLEFYEEASEELEKLYPEMYWDYRFLYDYGYALHKSGKFYESNQVLKEGASISSDPMFHNIMGKNFEALSDYDAAEQEYLRSHHMVPCRLYPMVLLMELYSKTGRDLESRKIAEDILQMPVNKKSKAMIELRERAGKMLLLQ